MPSNKEDKKDVCKGALASGALSFTVAGVMGCASGFLTNAFAGAAAGLHVGTIFAAVVLTQMLPYSLAAAGVMAGIGFAKGKKDLKLNAAGAAGASVALALLGCVMNPFFTDERSAVQNATENATENVTENVTENIAKKISAPVYRS